MKILSQIRIWLYLKSLMLNVWRYRTLYGMDIGEGTMISRKAVLDKGNNPQGIHIGCNTSITGGVVLLAHDACRRIKADIHIGDNCFIGNYAVIMPGVHIGNEVIIGAGSIVTKDIPDNCIAAGNPAKVIKQGIKLGKLGRLQ